MLLDWFVGVPCRAQCMFLVFGVFAGKIMYSKTIYWYLAICLSVCLSISLSIDICRYILTTSILLYLR